jgi:hypothetical protein
VTNAGISSLNRAPRRAEISKIGAGLIFTFAGTMPVS